MTTHHHMVVWIDHKLAKAVHFDKDSSETVVVHSSDAKLHLHHKANSSDSGHAPTDKKFLERVTAAMANAGAILIVGPAGAKTELLAFIKRAHPEIAARISAVEPMDHPTDGQLLAHARQFFVVDDRMRAQVSA